METQDRNKLIIIVVAVLVLLCCCLALIVAWYTGDYFVNAINGMSSLLPAYRLM
ncbi:MAG: hypothetical protein Fur0018_26970 [Anaerolineales bacterium]